MPVIIGTSGWQYKDWRGRFYPQRLAQARWLEYYADRFATVEVNNSFYRLPKPETFAAWRERLPGGFVMTVKVNRYITHLKQLKDVEEPVATFLEAAAPLGDKTGPMLIQLPPRLAVNHERLRKVLAAFPTPLRVAVEFRHPSWFDDETNAILRERNAALVLTDRRSKLLEPEWKTADWGYIRFHEGTEQPWPHYGDDVLRAWAERIARCRDRDDDVFVYFNNDPGCWAIADAITFARCVDETGLPRTAVPPVEEVEPRVA